MQRERERYRESVCVRDRESEREIEREREERERAIHYENGMIINNTASNVWRFGGYRLLYIYMS